MPKKNVIKISGVCFGGETALPQPPSPTPAPTKAVAPGGARSPHPCPKPPELGPCPVGAGERPAGSLLAPSLCLGQQMCHRRCYSGHLGFGVPEIPKHKEFTQRPGTAPPRKDLGSRSHSSVRARPVRASLFPNSCSAFWWELSFAASDCH